MNDHKIIVGDVLSTPIYKENSHTIITETILSVNTVNSVTNQIKIKAYGLNAGILRDLRVGNTIRVVCKSSDDACIVELMELIN